MCPNWWLPCLRISAKEQLGAGGSAELFEEVDHRSKRRPLNFPNYTRLSSEDWINCPDWNFALIKGQKLRLGSVDSNFIMASMGSVVGEKLLVYLVATRKIASCSLYRFRWLARMQVSLMQMAKFLRLFQRHSKEKFPC